LKWFIFGERDAGRRFFPEASTTAPSLLSSV
jgi:hypothetical protein